MESNDSFTSEQLEKLYGSEFMDLAKQNEYYADMLMRDLCLMSYLEEDRTYAQMRNKLHQLRSTIRRLSIYSALMTAAGFLLIFWTVTQR